jgi:hypothetical protein
MTQGTQSVQWKVWGSLYDGFAAAVVHDVEPLRTIAEVRRYEDARLIASAPALLEALRAYLDIEGRDLRGEPVASVERYQCMNTARAAISQATGEQQ